MASNLRVLLILAAIVISALSGIANEGFSDSDKQEAEFFYLYDQPAKKGDPEAQVELGWHNYRKLKDNLTEAHIKLAETYAKKFVGDKDNLARAALLFPSPVSGIPKEDPQDDLQTALVQEKTGQLREASNNDAAEAKIKAEWLNLQNRILELTAKNKAIKEEFEAAWLNIRNKLLEDNKKQAAEAFDWFKKAAENTKADLLTNAAAELGLGFCYMQGIAVEKDEINADKFFSKGNKKIEKNRKSAEDGESNAQYLLAQQFQSWVRWDAKNWLIHEYKILKNPETISGSADYVEAAKWLKKAAEQNHEEAQYTLGKCYAEGEGVSEDEAEAVKLYRKSAEQGYAQAQVALGDCYWKGKGVSKDRVEAVKWYRKAAAKGDPLGKITLGLLRGDFSSMEYTDAARGDMEAQRWLGFCHAEGFGVQKDLEEAIKWLRKAATQGNQRAQEDLDKLLKENKQPKLALLIANSNYSHFGGLANTIPDAKALANVLNYLGFQVYLLQDASREQILDALKSFENKVRGNNALAFFHFGGHGVQVEGKNYLIPADAEIPDERRVTTRAVDLDEVIASLESAKPKASVLVVDACRHNPLPATATRSATRGLAVVGRKPKNSVIIFAAEAGNEALDGLFTPVFAKALSENRDKSLNQIMQKVRSEVFNRSNGTQTPGEYNQLFDDVYLYKVN
jgi:TPR repeat protein